MEMDTILIMDFGGQYCHLIGRRIREMGVYSEIVPCDTNPEKIFELEKNLNVKGIILSGGPLSIYSSDSPKMDRKILEMGLPILGICYGHQLLAYYLGGVVKKAQKPEYGRSTAIISSKTGVLHGLKDRENVWMSHGDSVMKLPSAAHASASSPNCK